MTAQFNHTIIASLDPQRMAKFYLELLEAREEPGWGPFANISLAHGVLLQFAAPPIDFPPQHYAYLLDDEHFDRAYATVCKREIEHWADPQRQLAGRINRDHGGRGVYLLDPSRHYLELITRPYLPVAG